MKAALWPILTLALWQIPLLALLAWLCAKAPRSWPAVWQVVIWRGTAIAAIALPLLSALADSSAVPGFGLMLPVQAAAGAARSLASGAQLDWLWIAYVFFTSLLVLRFVVRCVALARLDEQKIRVPMTFGILAPRILLPRFFQAQASSGALAVALAHEQTHVQNHDFAWNLAMELLSLPIAFHPANAWIHRQLRIAVELRCDEAAAQQLGDAKTYALGLLEAAELLQQSARMPLVSTLLPQALLEENCLEKRIENLMTQKSTPTPRARWMAIASLSTLLFLASFASIQLALQAQQETVYSVRDAGVTAPAVLSKTEPVFTPQAREKKISGTVVLAVVISSAGQISEAKVLRSLEESLDENAIAAVKTWSFRPATKDGSPVACKATIEVNFRRS